MLQLRVTDLLPTEGTYKGFVLIAADGCLYGVPPELGPPKARTWWRLCHHPAILTAPNWEELHAQIDQFDPTPLRSEVVGQFEDYALVRHGKRIYGVPQKIWPVNLNLDEDRSRDGIVCGESCEEVRRLIPVYQAATPVEFAGWLPVYQRFGDCGNHPQFQHTQTPPPGYKFVRSGTGVKDPDPLLFTIVWFLLLVVAALLYPFVATIRYCWQYGPFRCLAVSGWAVWLFVKLLCRGGRPDAVFRFVRSRHFGSQIRLKTSSDLVFLTSMPYTYGQRPWAIEIEDSTTLLYPFIQNGVTRLLPIERSPFVRLVRLLLESRKCRAIVTHMRSTAETVGTLLKSETIAQKTHYIPMGVRIPPRYQRHEDAGPTLELLFTNSWHQEPVGFFTRGGIDVLEAFALLKPRFPRLRLTIRARMPALGRRYRDIIERCQVRLLQDFLPPDEMNDLMQSSHVYLLPAARIHVVSVLQAMSFGQAVVVSDGWGFDEYVINEHNGLIVPGRASKVSWMDEVTGLLREDYSLMHRPDRAVVQGLVESVSRLVEDPSLRREIGSTARADVEEKYNWEQWNQKLGDVLDQARGIQ